jgi:hypothetical protein
MTERQINSVKNKIVRIKKALAADKREWGGEYHDGRGLRYLPPQHYIKIKDYKGALRYFNWFHKNFSDDSGYPDFLFEWTIVLFFNNQLQAAEKKAFATFFANTYYFDRFFNKPIIPISKGELRNWESADMTKTFAYSCSQPELNTFADWLLLFINSHNFKVISQQFINISLQLENEPTGEKRSELVRRFYLFKNNV